jgi:hypothetical protein
LRIARINPATTLRDQ